MMERVLFLGAHPDDMETGSAGLLMKLLGKAKCFHIVFTSGVEQPGNETIFEEFDEAMRILGMPKGSFEMKDIPNTRFPEHEAEIRKILEEARDKWCPDTIVTHYIPNLHQDHETVTKNVLRVFKTQTILMYEDFKSTPGFLPNLLIPLTQEEIEKKVRVLEAYRSQFRRYYHDMDYVRAIAKMRGKRVNLDYAEAFYVYQMILNYD